MLKKIVPLILIFASIIPFTAKASLESDLRAVHSSLSGIKERSSRAQHEQRAAGAACIFATGTLAVWGNCCAGSELCANGAKYEFTVDSCNRALKDVNGILSFLANVEKAFSQLVADGKIDWTKFPDEFKVDVARFINGNYPDCDRAVKAIHSCNRSGLNQLVKLPIYTVASRVDQSGMGKVAAAIEPQTVTVVNYTDTVTCGIMSEMISNMELDDVPSKSLEDDRISVGSKVSTTPSELPSVDRPLGQGPQFGTAPPQSVAGSVAGNPVAESPIFGIQQ